MDSLSDTTCYINNLPNEILDLILRNLRFKIFAFKTCSKWRNIIFAQITSEDNNIISKQTTNKGNKIIFKTIFKLEDIIQSNSVVKWCINNNFKLDIVNTYIYAILYEKLDIIEYLQEHQFNKVLDGHPSGVQLSLHMLYFTAKLIANDNISAYIYDKILLHINDKNNGSRRLIPYSLPPYFSTRINYKFLNDYIKMRRWDYIIIYRKIIKQIYDKYTYEQHGSFISLINNFLKL